MGVVFVVIGMGGLGVAYVGFAGLLGRLRPNHWAGIRTGFTRASEQNWTDVHRAAGVVFLLGAMPVVAAGFAFAPFAFAGKIGDTLAIVVAVAGVMVLVGTVMAAWIAGTSYAAARATHGGSAPE
jgi:uncharacterized membrane protein